MKSSLFKHAAIYAIPNFLNAGVAFIVLPILTRYLEPSEYGILSNFNALLAVMVILVGFSSQGAIAINYFHLSTKKLAEYVTNISFLLVFSVFVISCIVWIFYDFMAAKIGFSVEWAIAAVILAGGNIITSINLAIWQADQKPRPYAILQMALMTLNVALSLFFVVVLSWGWQGRALGLGLASLVFSIVSGVLLLHQGRLSLTFCINREYLRDALSFGVPLIPHQLSFWLRTGIDRFILTLMVSTTATGLYNASFQAASVLLLVFTAFNQAWSPYLYRQLINADGSLKRKMVKFTYLYFVVVLIFASIATVLMPLVLNLLLGVKYQGSGAFVGYICFGFAFQGMYFMVCNYIFYVKKTAPLSCVTFSCGVLHIILCYFLVKHNGAVGAAQAFTLSSFLTFMGVWKLSAKVYKMPWLLQRGA